MFDTAIPEPGPFCSSESAEARRSAGAGVQTTRKPRRGSAIRGVPTCTRDRRGRRPAHRGPSSRPHHSASRLPGRFVPMICACMGAGRHPLIGV
jgi:hypothetical protein